MRFQPFQRFQHMAWAKRVETAAERDLAVSGMPPCAWSDLDLDPREFQMVAPNPYGLRVWREALAGRFGVSDERVVPVAGASTAIFAAVALFAGPGERVVVESPGYEALRRVPALFGARVERILRRPRDRFTLDLDALRRLARRPPRLLIVSDLHNPSGAALSEEERAELIRAAERGGFPILCDEVYREFLHGPPAPLALASPRVISAGSLTKAYGLGPLRAGWMLASPVIAERLRGILDLAYVEGASIAEAIAARALGRLDLLAARRDALLRPRRRVLDAWLNGRTDLETLVVPDVPFAFPMLPRGLTGRKLSDDLLRRHGTAVAPGEFFGASRHVRLSCAALAPAPLAEALAMISDSLDRFNREPPPTAVGEND